MSFMYSLIYYTIHGVCRGRAGVEPLFPYCTLIVTGVLQAFYRRFIGVLQGRIPSVNWVGK